MGEKIKSKTLFSFFYFLILAKIYTCLKAFFSHHQVEAEAKEHGLDSKMMNSSDKRFELSTEVVSM